MPLSQGLLPQVGPWGKSLHPFAGACGLSMGGVGSFLVVVFFKPGQTSICYSKLSIQHGCCCYFFIEHFGSAAEHHTQSKSFPRPLSLIIFYKVWLALSYPLTAPAPNIAQTTRKAPGQPCHAGVVTGTV